jgi:hypothetical protein
MAERAAHLVDHVFPEVPVRQWVLSLPHRLRYVLAWDHELCRGRGCVRACGPRFAPAPRAGERRVLRRWWGSRDHSTVRRRAEPERARWTDGTTHLVFDPLQRLAALTPRPRISLVLYYGVLGARSVWRARLAASDSGGSPTPLTMPDAGGASRAHRSRTNWLWADLMQRSFGFDVLACQRCGGRLELIALIEDPRVIRRILDHLGLPADVPAARPARSPPLPGASRDAVGTPAPPSAHAEPWSDDDIVGP